MTNENLHSTHADETRPRKKIHELDPEELDDYWINERCQFRDSKWIFIDHAPVGSSYRKSIDWHMKLHDGSFLNDPIHSIRLHWAKVLFLTMTMRPARRRVPKISSYGLIQTGFTYLMSYMSICGYQHPSELTPPTVQAYIDHLAIFLATRDGEISAASCINALSILKRLWDQRYAMNNMGIMVMDSHPFEGETMHSVAQSLATKVGGWVKPIPDEVAVPLFNKAAWFLGAPADDVLRLLHIEGGPLEPTTSGDEKFRVGRRCAVRDATGRARKKYLDQDFFAGFRFSTPANASFPWHPPLDPTQAEIGPAPATLRAAELWGAVRDAALVVVQATSGMRSSELLSINAGIDEASGLPSGVRLERSITGLYEWFVIRSDLTKIEQGLPRAVDWVLGMRPLGSDEIPLAVRALIILNKLYEPWRTLARTPNLVLGPCLGKTLPAAHKALWTMCNSDLNKTMRRFIIQWLDLSGLPDESAHKCEDYDLVRWRESRGMVFTTHMLRKSWAQYSLACDSRLLPVIQMQFHHLSLAMTEGGYIGRNPLLLEALDSMAVQKRNLMIFEAVTGKKLLAGRMGEQLERGLDQLRAEVGDLPTSAKWQKAVEWADRNDLTLFFSAHATCSPARTSQMRCHDASNTPVWLRKVPNTATREPSMCAGCACAIMDSSHEKFWSERYVSCKVTVVLAEAAGASMGTFREIRFRADQARGILKKFGADLVALDAQARLKMEDACQS